MDLNRKYPEETYGGPYYNHLVDYIGQGCFVIGYRSKRDFVDVAHEILYLAGERKPPDGWMPPNKNGSISRLRIRMIFTYISI